MHFCVAFSVMLTFLPGRTEQPCHRNARMQEICSIPARLAITTQLARRSIVGIAVERLLAARSAGSSASARSAQDSLTSSSSSSPLTAPSSHSSLGSGSAFLPVAPGVIALYAFLMFHRQVPDARLREARAYYRKLMHAHASNHGGAATGNVGDEVDDDGDDELFDTPFWREYLNFVPRKYTDPLWWTPQQRALLKVVARVGMRMHACMHACFRARFARVLEFIMLLVSICCCSAFHIFLRFFITARAHPPTGHHPVRSHPEPACAAAQRI